MNLPGYEIGTYFDTDGKSKLFYFVETDAYFQPEARLETGASTRASSGSRSRTSPLRVGPGYEDIASTRSTSRPVDDPTPTADLRRRLRVRDARPAPRSSANIRLNWAFTPRLSASSSRPAADLDRRVHGLQVAGAAEQLDFSPLRRSRNGRDNFNFKSLRGNAVFRWEYLPGSAFYLVWTQELDGSDFGQDGDFNMTDNLNELAGAPIDEPVPRQVHLLLHAVMGAAREGAPPHPLPPERAGVQCGRLGVTASGRSS